MKQVTPLNFQGRLSRLIIKVPRKLTIMTFTLVGTVSRSLTSPYKVFMSVLTVAPTAKNRRRIRHRVFLTIEYEAVQIQHAIHHSQPYRVVHVVAILRMRIARCPTPRLIRCILAIMLRNSRRHVTRALNACVIITNIRRVNGAFIILPVRFIQAFRGFVPSL